MMSAVARLGPRLPAPGPHIGGLGAVTSGWMDEMRNELNLYLATCLVAAMFLAVLSWSAAAGTNCISTRVGNTTYTYCT
jgi:hypothetical protein